MSRQIKDNYKAYIVASAKTEIYTRKHGGLTLHLMGKQGMAKESNQTGCVTLRARTAPFSSVVVMAYPLPICLIPDRVLQVDL